MNEDILSITSEDLDAFALENQLSSTEEKEFKLGFYDEGKKAIDLMFKDDPDKRVTAYQQFESAINNSLSNTRNKAIQEYALAAHGGDREAANESISTAFNWHKSYDSRKASEPAFVPTELGIAQENTYGLDKSDEQAMTIFGLLRSKDFQLNEKTSVKPSYLNDSKGNPIAEITTRSEGDKRTAFYKFFDNKDLEISQLKTQELSYSLPSDSDVASYIAEINQKVKDGYPAGGYGETPYAKSIAKAFDQNPSKEAQKVRDLMKEAAYLNSASPSAAKEFIATKKRNEAILSSDYVRQNITDINMFEDIAKGVMRFEGTALNAITDGGEQDNLTALDRDSSMGSVTEGLKDSGFDAFLKKGVVPGSEALGNMLIPLAAGGIGSIATAGAIESSAPVLTGMAVSSYGAQLHAIDSSIAEVESSMAEKARVNSLDPELALLKSDLTKLKANRTVNAIGHAIVETGTESLGGVGGVFLKPIGKTALGRFATTMVEETFEEFAAEPLNYIVDQATIGERLTPDMQDPLSIFYATSVATAPLAIIGAAGGVNNREKRAGNKIDVPLFEGKTRLPINPTIENPTEDQVKIAAQESTAMSEALTQFDASKEEDDASVKETLDAVKTEPVIPVGKIAIPNSSFSPAPEKEGEDIQSTEKSEIEVDSEHLEHAHSIFEQATDFNDFSNRMQAKFGSSIVNSLKSIWDYILNSFKSAYGAISDSITYATQNAQGNSMTFKEAGESRKFASATNYKTATVEKLEEVKKKYPALYNTALQSLLAQVDAHGTTNIKPADLARLYSFKEKGFTSGVSIVDEGNALAELEGRSKADGAFTNPDGTPNEKAPVLTADEQRILRVLYHTRVINEDQLSGAARGIFGKRKFLSLYARAKGKNVTQLNNSADSTTSPVEKRQSKVKEAYSTDSVISPANDSAERANYIEASYVHGTNDANDVLTHLGITPIKGGVEGANADYFYLKKNDLKKLYAFYDSKFGKNNWVVKDSSGAAGAGFHSADSLKADLKSKNYNGINYEGVVQKKLNIHSEYRVNVYLDSKGKARAVPFAMSKKELYADGRTSHDFPYRVTTKTVDRIQKFAEAALERSSSRKQDKSTGKGAIYGIDVAILNNEDGSDPFGAGTKMEMKVIEFNSADPYHDANNIGGVTGTFSRHGGFPMANLQAFLRGKTPADIALTNVMLHMLKNGSVTVDGQSLVPSHVIKKNGIVKKSREKSTNPTRRSIVSSGIDPTNLISDIKLLFNAAKDFASWSKSLIEKYGPSVKSHLNEIWKIASNSKGLITENDLKEIGVINTIIPDKDHQSKRLADIKRVAEANPITQAYRYRIDERFLSPVSVGLLRDIRSDKLRAGDVATVIEDIKAEERTNKFAKMKRMTPNAFTDFVLDPYSEESMDLATATLLDYLDAVGSDPTAAQAPRRMTKARKEAEIQLNENIGLFQGGYVNHPDFINLPVNLKEVIIAGVNEISKMNDGTSTNNIKRAAASLGSLLDNGNPVGFMKYANEYFSNTWISRAVQLDKLTSGNVNQQVRSLIGNPISNYRRGHLNNEIGSFLQLGIEIDKFSKGDHNIFLFMSDLFSSFIGNLDAQQAERDIERGDFTNFVERNYPRRRFLTAINDETNSMPAVSRARAGIAATLIQYKVNSQDPLVDLRKHFNLMNLGINYRSEIEDQRDLADIDRASFNYLTAGLDYDTMNYNQIINTILNRLSPQERNVLDYLITRSSTFLPAMRVVSAMSGNRQLEEWENYTHQKVLSVIPDNTISGLAAFNSMEPPLQIRKGLGTETDSTGNSRAKGYYETDILTLGDDFFHMATYEKHTGVQRQMLKNLLSDPNFTDMLENAGEESVKPKTERIKELMGNAHAVRSNSNFLKLGSISSALLELIGIGKGFTILSTGMLFGNLMSAVTTQLGILSLEGNAASLIFPISVERVSHGAVARGLRQVMEQNFPSQMHRLVAYDEARAAHTVKNRSLKMLEDRVAAGHSRLNAVFSHGLGVAYNVPVKALKAIGKTLSYVFGSFAEGQSATNMWWSVYIDRVNQTHGTSFVNGEDYLTNPIIDNDASTYATLQVDRMTGNTSTREHQGSTYHLNTLTKIGITNTIMPFLRQQTQLSQQTINEIQHARSASTNTERARHLYRAGVLLASNAGYTAVKYVMAWFLFEGLASTEYIQSLITGGDDEEAKKVARLEMERQHEIRKRKRDFNLRYDLLATTVANPFFNSSIARTFVEYGHDLLKTKPEDAERALAIKNMEKDIRNENAVISVSQKLNDFKTQSRSMDRIRSLEESIEKMKNMQGLSVAPKGKYAAMTANLGPLSVITDQSYGLLEMLEEKTETEAAIAQRADELNRSPAWLSIADKVLKTGVTRLNKNISTELAQKQLKAESERDNNVKEAIDRINRRLGL